MHLDIVTLSRIQFAFTIMFHYIFPPLSFGLGLLLVIMEGLFLKTGNPLYEAMTKFWVKIFAINFAVGVATGVVMEFQFGTNWAGYSQFVGDVFGAALAAEGIFAFFLESGFLAVLLFGWERVSSKIHFFATCMVALGAIFSAFWINVANSWQQTPAGFHVVQHAGLLRAEVTDFWAVVFNPSSVSRFTHAVMGGWIQAAFLVMSISAFYLLRKRHTEFAQKSFIIALILAALVMPLQVMVGSHQGEIVARYQPAKLAAFEGLFHTERNASLWVIGFPDEGQHRVNYGIRIPGLLSYLAKRDFNAEIKGLLDFPKTDWPPVSVSFYAFHLMVGMGLFLLGLSWYGLYAFWKGNLFQSRWLLWTFMVSVGFPYLTNQLGWVAAEVGRQPWVVYGILRTRSGVSQVLHGEHILISLAMFSVIYALLLLVFLYSLDRKIKHGPELPALPHGHPGEHPVEEWVSTAGERINPAEHTDMMESDS